MSDPNLPIAPNSNKAKYITLVVLVLWVVAVFVVTILKLSKVW